MVTVTTCSSHSGHSLCGPRMWLCVPVARPFRAWRCLPCSRFRVCDRFPREGHAGGLSYLAIMNRTPVRVTYRLVCGHKSPFLSLLRV